ncbi:hypothetical protein ABZ646_37860, partial [Streptomyces sp. NPDC007162]|uniref:hypothetical protein n=1 Tax=Streptomyces sp. NPDC007162 TaxID=3156917 RepID=UPI0033DD0996
AVVADPLALGGQPLAVDELAALLQPGREVVQAGRSGAGRRPVGVRGTGRWPSGRSVPRPWQRCSRVSP